MANYSVSINESSRELTAKERIAIKDVTNAIKLDEATKDGSITISPIGYAVLGIHNDKSDDKDYENYVIITDGAKYVTGSKSLWNSFKGIWDEMVNEDEEFAVEIYRVPSKNYKGKDFLTCSIK